MNKINRALFAIICLSFCFASCGNKDDNNISLINIDGIWINKEVNTSGITMLIISKNGRTINGFGSCSPTDCDWGETELTINNDNANYEAVYPHSWSTHTLEVTPIENSELEVTLYIDFTEEDGRTDLEIIGYFEQN